MGPETSKVLNQHLGQYLQNSEESGEMEDVQDSQDSTSDPLADQVKCQICTDVFHNPVALHFCGHVFCGGCVKRWLETNKTCPTCRSRVQKVTDDFRANNLLEVYLKMNPSKSRSSEETAELDAEYKRGDAIQVGAQADDDDEYLSDEDDEGLNTPPALYHEPCPTCLPGNPHGWTCTYPIPTAPGQQIPVVLAAPGHVQCGFCSSLLPRRYIPEEQCASCGTFSCHSLNGQDCVNSFLCSFKDFDFDAYMADHILITANCFNQNNTEYNKFMNYKRTHNMRTNQLRDQLVQYYGQNPGALRARRANVTPDSLVCKFCTARLLTDPLMEWWRHQVNDLHVIQDDRPRCWYGTECRTQRHSLRHAEGFNHLGPSIPGDERVDAMRDRN